MSSEEKSNHLDRVKFGKLIKSRREERGWSQEAVAATALGNADRRGQISRYESAKDNPSPLTVKKLCDALDLRRDQVPVSLRWLEIENEVQHTPEPEKPKDKVTATSRNDESSGEKLVTKASEAAKRNNVTYRRSPKLAVVSSVAAIILGTVAVFFLVPSEQTGCALIPVDKDQPLHGELDFSLIGSGRDCGEARPVALEFFNAWTDRESGETLTSANFLIDGSAASPSDPAVWHEYSQFTPSNGNRFDWKVFRTGRERFHIDGCGFDRISTTNNQDIEYRRGTFLLSNPRTDHTKHSPEERRQCNQGGPEYPEFSHCTYIRYETFVPTTELASLCAAGSEGIEFSSFDLPLLSQKDYDFLVSRANSESEAGKPIRPGILIDDFNRIIKDKPKICLRRVALDGSPIVGESDWGTFAYVARVLCDTP